VKPSTLDAGMWAPGARFGKYKLVERLGKGGMAETWRAELLAAEGVRRPVVIKRVLPSFSDNKEFVEAFVQEAKVTASLSHGNIAQVFDFGQVGDSHFIAMELIEGRSLDRVLKHGIKLGYWHMPYPIAALITLEIAKGLEHVHTRRGARGPLNIVHRDISPDNIIVGINGETKLVDFGVAKSVLEGRAETEAGVVKGKYIYFSPEQAAGEKVDFRTDIYALGVVLYRLVTGVKAFDGPGLKVIAQIQRGEYTPLRVANPGVPDDLATVIETMMAVRKEDRFATTLELVEALSACVVHMAPRAGVHWIRDWVRWLYQDELKKRGEEPGLRAGFTDLIEQWKPGPKPTLSGEMSLSGESRAGSGPEIATIDSRRESRRKATSASIADHPPVAPWSAKKKLYAGLAAGGGALLLIGFVALTTTKDPTEGESEEARNRRIAEATRMKPIGGSDSMPPAVKPPPVVPDPSEDKPRVDEADPPEPADDPPSGAEVQPKNVPEVAYDAEVAPVTFTLSSHHQVALDVAPVMPGASGSVTNAGPLSSGGGRSGAWSFPDLGDPSAQGGMGGRKWVFAAPSAGTRSQAEQQKIEVPAWLFTPGSPPVLELLSSGAGRWSRPDTRLAVLVGSSMEIPESPLNPTVGAKKLFARGAIVVVETNDRFTITDLTAQKTWKVTVTPKPEKGQAVGHVVLCARGEGVRVDGKPTVGGYAVLTPGTHRVSGASSAWLTVPTVSTLKLAPIEVSFAN